MAKHSTSPHVGGYAVASSIRALARHCGRAESSVRKWLRRDDWPFSREGPWDVARVKDWVAVMVKRDPASDYRRRIRDAADGKAEFSTESALTRVKVQRYGELALLTRQRRLKEAGELMESKEHQRLEAAAANAFRANLVPLARSLSAALVGQDRETIERLLSERFGQVLDAVANEMIDVK